MSMSKHHVIIWGFCLLAAVQIWVPLSMIARREATLRNGTAFNFRTRPVDPYDAFRGRYVALRYENDEAAVTNSREFTRGQTLYVMVETGTNGYATLGSASPTRPDTGDFLRTRMMRPGNANRVRVKLPFDRFYMNESDAPEAERQFRWSRRGAQSNAYARVRIRGGMAVIEDLYVDDLPILEFMKKEQPNRENR